MQRESIGSRFGFIMLSVGCAIGLGNVWRFPYMTGIYGGALFVLLYLVFLVLLGFPLMMMELAVGRAAGRGIYGAFRDLPEKSPSRWRYIAGIMFLSNLFLMMMYTTVTGWLLSYLTDFITGRACNLSGEPALRAHMEELLASPGRMSLFMVMVTLIGFSVGVGGLRRGVERITKILMAGLFVILIGLCIYSLFLPGAEEGVRFYLMPDLQKMKSDFFSTVSGAMAQAFFTLSVGIGSMTIFGSYIGKKHTLVKEAVLIIFCDTLVALLAGVVIFSACFSYGIDVSAGPGLLLVSLTGVFNSLPFGRWLGILFFIFLSFAALTTVIAVFENLVAFMIDEWHFSRRKASVINFIVVTLLSFPCLLGFNLLSDVHPLGGNSTILDFEDWLISDIWLPMGALMLTTFCCWKCGWGWNNFIGEVNQGAGLKLSKKSRWLITLIPPVLIVVLFATGMYNRFFAGMN